MQRTTDSVNRPRAHSFNGRSLASSPVTSSSSHSPRLARPTFAKRHGINNNDGNVNAVGNVRSSWAPLPSAPVVEDGNAQLTNHSAGVLLSGVVGRLRLEELKTIADRDKETLKIKKECSVLEAQRKAMEKGRTKISYTDFLRSSRMKKLQSDGSQSSRDSSPDGSNSIHSQPISPRLHTKLTRWRCLAVDARSTDTKDSDVQEPSRMARSRHPDRDQKEMVAIRNNQSGDTDDELEDSEKSRKWQQFYGDIYVYGGQLQLERLSGIPNPGEISNSDLMRGLSSPTFSSRFPASQEELDDFTTDPRKRNPKATDKRQSLLQHRPKTAAPKISRASVDRDTESADAQKSAHGCKGTPKTSNARTRSKSTSAYLNLAQSSVSPSSGAHFVSDFTISLHGRTTRELRELTNIDNIVAAATRERKKQTEDWRRVAGDKERQRLQVKVDNFLRKIDSMKNEETKKSVFPSLSATY